MNKTKIKMVERCKNKHWWNLDPHEWKEYQVDHGSYFRNYARECLACGLMQTAPESIEYNHSWSDATKLEFNKRVEDWKTAKEERKLDTLQHQQRQRAIEQDRMARIRG